MIRVDTAGLKEQMQPLGFNKAATSLAEEWEDGSTITVKDTDTDIPLYLPGFESARFKGLWSKINAALLEKQYGKCAYCEAKMAATSQADVEHFRPKAGYDPATGSIEAAMLGARGLVRSGYFWLAYSSSNYYAACRICNEVYKKNKFDLMPDSPRATYNTPAQEKPAFIDPGQEDPREILRFDPYTARAIPARLWDEYLVRKGKEDPLGTPVVKVGPVLSEAQKNTEIVELQGAFEILMHAAKEVCEAAKKNDKQFFLADNWSRGLHAESRKSGFTSDSPVGNAPYMNFGSPPEFIMKKGPAAALDYVALAWLFEVDPESAAFTSLTAEIAIKIQKPPALAIAACQFLAATQRTWIIPAAQKLVMTDTQTARAFYSIVHLGLNRTELIRARAEHLMKIRALFLFLKNNGLIKAELEAMLAASFSKDPVTAVSDHPNELDASLSVLSHAVSKAGQFASATLDALLHWRLELPEARATPHQLLTSMAAPSEPWLARYYRLANLPLRPDSEEADDASDDDDDAPDLSASDPTTQKLTPADCGYLCALQRFGVRLALLRSRHGLNVSEGDLLTSTALKHSGKKDDETEGLYRTEVRRLLAFHAQPEDIVRNSYIPAWAGDPLKYWQDVDRTTNTGHQLALAFRALSTDKSSKYAPVVFDKKAALAWWKKAYPKKKTLPAGLR